MVEDQTDLITRHEMDGTVTFVNGAFCRFFDKRRKSWWERTWMRYSQQMRRKPLLAMGAGLTPEKPTNSWESI